MDRIKRFSNNAQLVRYIARTTEMAEEDVWDKLDE